MGLRLGGDAGRQRIPSKSLTAAYLSPTLAANLKSQRWRLDNLYTVKNEYGLIVPFKLRWVQQHFFDNAHNREIILKARQQGFSTFIDLWMLDECLWRRNVRAGIVADTLDNAKNLLREKIYLPYDNLPAPLRERFPMKERNVESCEFENGSRIDVGVSLRGGTYQFLHVSELGPLSVKRPDKAKEVKTGALNTVHGLNRAVIESTGYGGQEGVFYQMCDSARGNPGPLTELDFQFEFYAWWMDGKNQLEAAVHVDDRLKEYFAKLALVGIPLTPKQKSWYVVKEREQGPDMKNEHPSTPEEAFAVTLEGTYYTLQLARALDEGRITKVPLTTGRPVHTFWDLGEHDDTVIWFVQFVGNFIHVIDCYSNSGEQPEHYVQVLQARGLEMGYEYGDHYMPHDVRVKVFGMAKTRIEQFLDLGIQPEIVPGIGVQDGINLVRRMLDFCIFDGERCEPGLRSLRNYRKEWDANRGCFKDKPRHDFASHAADAFRYLAVTWKAEYGVEEEVLDANERAARGHNVKKVAVEKIMLAKPKRTEGRIA